MASLAFCSPMALVLCRGGPRMLCSRRTLSMSAKSTDVAERVAAVISENPVVVFSKTWCGYSSRAKALLRDELKANPLVWELDQMPDGEEIQYELLKMTGQRTVPNIYVRQKHVGGCDDLFDLYYQGKLQGMIDEA